MAKDSSWGYRRIFGEMKKLRIKVSRSTVARVLKENGFDPGPKRGEGTWDEFIRRHLKTLWACDCAPCKCGSFQRVRFPPGNWSLQPVAIGAVVEATKLLKPPV